MWKKAKWIGLPEEEIREKQIYQGDMNGRFVYFRHSFTLGEDMVSFGKAGEGQARLTLDVTANSRYRLWVNGTAVQSGPCRGDRYRHYYETIDVSEYLVPGENVLAAQVLLCDHSYVKSQYGCDRAPLISVASLPSGHRLAVEGEVVAVPAAVGYSEETEPDVEKRKTAAEEKVLADVTTGTADWKVYLDDSFYLVAEPFISDNLGASIEHLDFAKSPTGWKTASFDDSAWRKADAIESVEWGDFEKNVGLYLDFHMKERPIPLLMEEPCVLTGELGEPVFGQQDQITVRAHGKQTLLFAVDVLRNTYPSYRFAGGKGTKVSFTYFERFVSAEGESEVRRDDYEHGEIGPNGLTDTIVLAAEQGEETVYEPFWYRTFRFLQIEIDAGEEDVTFFRPTYHRTGYPLNARSRITSSAPWVEQLFAMCVHTLEGCMMETYMDCPFWEQMQYPMDTRLQAMFTYVCSRDTALARKALEDFHCSKIPEGLVLGKAPTGYLQVITTFSLYYIFMLEDYYERTGDVETLRLYRGDVDEILDYYDRQIGSTGLVEHLDYWPFVDWQTAWGVSGGKPEAMLHGPSTIINLMYAYALLTGAKIQEAVGRSALAGEYRDRQREICGRVQTLCWDAERQMYREGPDFSQFSQHAQSWAVLNGMVSGEEAKALMARTFAEKDVLRCFFSTCYELFRACELAGCYDLTKQQMDWWIDLIDKHCTTCPETPVDSRSECHAWSAQPMYELMAVIAGIRRGMPGTSEFVICPHLDYVPDLAGEMTTDYGEIAFDYRKVDGKWKYQLTIPQGCSAIFRKENGERVSLAEGTQIIEEA